MLGLIVVNVFMYILGSGFTRFYAHITRIPYEILAAIVLTFCIAGAYSTNNRMYDIYIILIFGIVAYFLQPDGFSVGSHSARLCWGLWLRKTSCRALVLSDGSLDIFFIPSYQLCLYLDCCRFYFAVCLEKSQGKGKKHTEIIQICASTETSPYLSIAKFIQFEERRCLR